MCEIFVPMPSKKINNIYLQQNIDGFFVGIQDYSSNFNTYYKLSDLPYLIDIKNKYNKKIYISLNRLYYNSEIDKVKKLIKELIKYNIDGICYTDVGVLNILNELKYNKDIIWYSNHLGTNSKTINYLEKKNVNYSVLSTEINLKDIISIKKNTNIKIGVLMYGYINMATSSRKLLTNYFEYIDKKKKNNKYIIKDKVKDNTYSLVEERDTNFFTNSVLNGLKFMPKLIKNKMDFIVLDDYMLDEKNFYNVIEAFSLIRNTYDDKEFIKKLEKVVESNTESDTFYGFLNKTSVYKVKDYE